MKSGSLSNDHIATAERAKPLAEWRNQALCEGRADLFNPAPGHGDKKSPGEKEAIATCLRCPVILQCTRDVLKLSEGEDFGGIVAGLTERERTTLRRVHGKGKRCPSCKDTKAATEFSPNLLAKRDGLATYCKPCEAKRQREANAAKRAAEKPADGPGASRPISAAGKNDSENDFAATNYEINLRDFEIEKEGLTPAENMKQTPHFSDQQGAA